MNKDTNRILMGYAEKVLQEQNCPLFKNRDAKIIHESYNGQIAAFGVSILMIGLKPTLAVYYQDKSTNEANASKSAYRENVLKVIMSILALYKTDCSFQNIEELIRHVLSLRAGGEDNIKRDILNCSVALKQVIRTYKME